MNPADQFSLPTDYRNGSYFAYAIADSISNLTGVTSVSVIYFHGSCWYRSQTGKRFPKTSLDNILYRNVIQNGCFVEIPDVFNHASYKFIALKMAPPHLRYISAVPIVRPCKIVTGVFILHDLRRQTLPDSHVHILESLARALAIHLESKSD